MDEPSESNGCPVGGAAEAEGGSDPSSPTSKTSAPEPTSRGRLLTGAGLVALFLVPLAWWLAVLLGADEGTRTWAEHAGAAGDSVAWLTALFTAGALIAALWSVRLQRRELELQREEMALQRAEMVASKAELARQARALEEQIEASRELARAMQAQAQAFAAGTERAAELSLIDLRLRLAELHPVLKTRAKAAARIFDASGEIFRKLETAPGGGKITLPAIDLEDPEVIDRMRRFRVSDEASPFETLEAYSMLVLAFRDVERLAKAVPAPNEVPGDPAGQVDEVASGRAAAGDSPES